MSSQPEARPPVDDAAGADRLTRLWAAIRIISFLLGTGGTAVALFVVRLGGALLCALALVVVMTGLMHLGRAVIHRRDPEYAGQRETRDLVRAELRFAVSWIAAGGLLAVLAVRVPSTLVVSIAGAITTFTIYVYAIANAGDIVEAEAQFELLGGSATVEATEPVRRWRGRARRAPRLPGTLLFVDLWGRKTPEGEVSAYFNATLLALAFAFVGFVGLAAAGVVSGVVEHLEAERPAAGGRRPADSAGGAATSPEALPYARLCPALPDPLAIGHGLGELFKRAGAVQGGCAELPIHVSEPEAVWMARGMCDGRLRSVAVSSAATGAALLYGAPAAYTWDAGVLGLLRYAQIARSGTGEIAIVATLRGAAVFMRSSPSLRAGRRVARRCSDVDDLARPYVHLSPPLAALWLRLAQQFGWSWPVHQPATGSGLSVSFVEPWGGRVVARGGCDARGTCYLDSANGLWSSTTGAMITLADVAAHMPAPVK